MTLIHKNKAILLPAILLLWLSACSAQDKALTSAEMKVPADFNAGQSKTEHTPLTIDQFFTDKALTALIDTVLQNNADIKIVLQKVEAAKASLMLHRGALMPSLDATVTTGAMQYGRYTVDGSGVAESSEISGPSFYDHFAGLSSSWEADLWGKLKNRKRAAQLRYLASEAGSNLITTNIVAEAAYRYYALVSLDEELEIIQKNIKLQEDALSIIKMQKEGGRATELAVKQFAAQLYRTQGMEYRVKQDIRITENELNFLLGRYKGAIIRNRPSSPPTASVAAGIPAQMLSNRADILQAEAELKATKAEIAAAKAAFFPSVSITAMAGFNSYDASLLFDPKSFAFNILGGIAAPLFNRNTVKANHKLSLAENKGAFYQFCKTVMNAYHEVNTALTNMDNLEKQHQLNKQEADALNESVKIANDLYIAGYANYLEVITAQKNALEAELNVVHTRQKQQYNNINLYRALGGGWRK